MLGNDVAFSETIPSVVSMTITVVKWHQVNHHEAHAALGFYASPFSASTTGSALAVSYDGGGNDGSFNAYIVTSGHIKHVRRLDYNFGDTYLHLGELLPEVSKVDLRRVCKTGRNLLA